MRLRVVGWTCQRGSEPFGAALGVGARCLPVGRPAPRAALRQLAAVILPGIVAAPTAQRPLPRFQFARARVVFLAVQTINHGVYFPAGVFHNSAG
jgi:hypothetical protein